MADDAVDLLTRLVSMPSPTGKESAVADALVRWMSDHGIEASVDEAGNAVGVKGTGEKHVLLLGHMDTFPGDVPVRREGDLMYGRGTVDAKGPLCAFAAALSRTDVPPDWRVILVGAVEEESESSKGARFILSQYAADGEGSRRPVCCIVGEPSGWDRFALGYKGILVTEICVQAPFTHSASRDLMPAEHAVGLWQTLKGMCNEVSRSKGADKAFDRLDVSLRSIRSHDRGAFGEVEMEIAFRLPLSIPPEDMEQQFLEMSRKAVFAEGPAVVVQPADEPGQGRYVLTDGATRLDIRAFGHETAFRCGKSNLLVRSMLPAIRRQGGTPRFVLKTGTCDMNVVGAQWADTPIVAYGPGDSSLDHAPNEHVSVGEYLRSIDVLVETLRRITESPAKQGG